MLKINELLETMDSQYNALLKQFDEIQKMNKENQELLAEIDRKLEEAFEKWRK